MNSRRFTAQYLSRASEQKNSTLGTAALRDFDPANEYFGNSY
jgi:hypothetical protein